MNIGRLAAIHGQTPTLTYPLSIGPENFLPNRARLESLLIVGDVEMTIQKSSDDNEEKEMK